MHWYLKKKSTQVPTQSTFVLCRLPLIESTNWMDKAAFCSFFLLLEIISSQTFVRYQNTKNRSPLKIDKKVVRSRSSGRLQPSSAVAAAAAAAPLLLLLLHLKELISVFQRASPGSISQQPRAKISEKRELTSTLRSSSRLQPRTRRWRRCTSWSADHTSMQSCWTKLSTSRGPFAQILVSWPHRASVLTEIALVMSEHVYSLLAKLHLSSFIMRDWLKEALSDFLLNLQSHVPPATRLCKPSLSYQFLVMNKKKFPTGTITWSCPVATWGTAS